MTMEQRVSAVLKQEGNNVCAECPEVAPTWACILVNPLERGGPKVGMLCCYKCYGHLLKLGDDMCEVKSTRNVAGECKF